MAWTKLKIAAAAIVIVGAVGTSAYVVHRMNQNDSDVVPVPSGGAAPAASIVTANEEPGWKDRFQAAYGLAPGQVVKHVAPPFPPEREMYWRETTRQSPWMANQKQERLYLDWDGSAQWTSCSIVPGTIGTTLEAAGFRPWEIEGPFDPYAIPMPGDFVFRKGASREAKLEQIRQIIQSDLGRVLSFTKQHVTRDAIIVSGDYHFTPLPGVRAKEAQLELFATPTVPKDGAESAASGYAFFRGSLEQMLRMQIVDPQPRQMTMVRSRNHHITSAVASDPQQLRQFLDNLSKQTGLTFAVEPRETDIWLMSQAAPPVDTTH